MRAFEFLLERSDSTPNVQDPNVPKTQQAITDKVQSIFDIDELNKIYSYVRKMDLGGGFDEVFEKDVDLKQIQSILSKAIIDSQGTFEEKMGFAKELVTIGCIDVDKLLAPGVTQNITDLVVTDYPQIYSSIASTLMNIAGAFKSGATKTNRGKGEFFLSILSPEITLSKAGHGDLTIRGQGYEVKDNLARIKGRKGYGTTDQVRVDVSKQVDNYIKKVLKKNPESPLAGKTFSVGVGAKQNLWTDFGPLAIQSGENPGDVVKFLRGLWSLSIRGLFLNATNAQVASVTPMNEQGVIDFKALHNPMKALAFDYYKTADGFAGALFVNSSKMTITYIETAEQFIQLIGIKKYGFEPGAQNGMQVSTP
jgi:hypothetical protein